MDWIKMDSVNFTRRYEYIVCDTRDFHIGISDDKDENNALDEFISKYAKDVYIIDLYDIYPKLSEIKRWKINLKQLLLKVRQKEFTGWLKYIRFKKISETKYIVYTTTGKDYHPIDLKNVINDIICDI